MPIRVEEDVGRVRRAVAAAMDAAGAAGLAKTKLVTAASELARNTLTHGGGGEVQIETVRNATGAAAGGCGVVLTFADAGSGIADLERALTDGVSTGAGLGLGLGGARRLCDEFAVAAGPAGGTVVRVAMWTRRR